MHTIISELTVMFNFFYQFSKNSPTTYAKDCIKLVMDEYKPHIISFFYSKFHLSYSKQLLTLCDNKSGFTF